MVKVSWNGKNWIEDKDNGMYIDGYLRSNLDIMREEIKKDWDFVILIDGREGAGKSVLAQTVAKYLDPTLDVKNIVFRPQDFVDRVKGINEKFKCIIYDEAYGGLCSSTALHAKNKAIRQMLTEIRMKNLFLVIVLPSFFDLVKYVAMWRSACMLHVRVEKLKRGFFSFYNYTKKKDLYINGKKFYSYQKPSPDFFGRFTNQYTVDESIYKARKKAVVEQIEDDEDKTNRYKRNEIINKLSKDGWSLQKIADLFNLSKTSIYEIVKKFQKTD